MVTGGLSGRGSRGLYDRFRGRLVWPIRDITGDTVGFGARRLFDDDRIAAKYLNTSETPIYKKSQVLYGLDLAKKAISTERQAVVVEGYTDVMACHLSGVETRGRHLRHGLRHRPHQDPAPHHARRDRRPPGRASSSPSTATPPARRPRCGPSARTSAGPRSPSSPSRPDGMDPCELRIAKGDAAVRALVDDAVPMFEFAVRTTIRRFDLDTAEGRVQAMKAVAPIIGSIRDTSLRPEYTRTVSGWLGIEVEQMAAEVKKAGRVRHDDAVDTSQRPAGTDEVPEPGPGEAASLPVPDLRDPVVFTERQLLQALIQYPQQFTDATVDALRPEEFVAPAHRAVLDGIRIAAPTARRASTAAWVAAVGEAAPLAVRSLVSELSVAPLPTRFDSSSGLPPQRYLDSLVVGVRDAQLGRLIADAMASVRRVQNDPDSDPTDLRERTMALHRLELERVALRERLSS